jgi:hypothetical protein
MKEEQAEGDFDEGGQSDVETGELLFIFPIKNLFFLRLFKLFF